MEEEKVTMNDEITAFENGSRSENAVRLEYEGEETPEEDKRGTPSFIHLYIQLLNHLAPTTCSLSVSNNKHEDAPFLCARRLRTVW